LKADDTLPKVTQVADKNFNDLGDGPNQRTFEDDEEGGHDLSDEDVKVQQDEVDKPVHEESIEVEEEKVSRKKRSVERKSRGFCDGGGVFCALYRAIQGEPIKSHLIAERREETGPTQPRYEGPPTPCPAKVEYGKKIDFLIYI
jgi:hypothetical protein